jgi:hypothetical protein
MLCDWQVEPDDMEPLLIADKGEGARVNGSQGVRYPAATTDASTQYEVCRRRRWRRRGRVERD